MKRIRLRLCAHAQPQTRTDRVMAPDNVIARNNKRIADIDSHLSQVTDAKTIKVLKKERKELVGQIKRMDKMIKQVLKIRKKDAKRK